MAFLGVFIASPWLTIVPVAVFAALFISSRRFAPVFAAMVWLLYGIYEYGMKVRWLCTGECNIRVDLLVIYPVLILVSIAGLVSGFRRASSTKHSKRRSS